MAHFAKLDEDNVVLEVLVVNNEDILDSSGTEIEQIGITLLTDITGHSSWKQTSRHANFRKQYAAIGYKYDNDKDVFYDPNKPFESWSFNNSTMDWEAPAPIPDDNGTGDENGNLITYVWNEETRSWDEIIVEQWN